MEKKANKKHFLIYIYIYFFFGHKTVIQRYKTMGLLCLVMLVHLWTAIQKHKTIGLLCPVIVSNTWIEENASLNLLYKNSLTMMTTIFLATCLTATFTNCSGHFNLLYEVTMQSLFTVLLQRCKLWPVGGHKYKNINHTFFLENCNTDVINCVCFNVSFLFCVFYRRETKSSWERHKSWRTDRK